MIKVGAARTNITPPLGVCMAGSFGVIRARDVWDELYANALVIEDDGKQVAIVSVDVCSIDTPSYRDICGQIAEMTGIPADRVILAATHTHSGPATGNDLDGIYEVDPDYDRLYRRQVASAVRLAQQRMQSATVSVGRSENRAFLFNRRLQMPDGSIMMNWVDPSLLSDAQAPHVIDPELLLLRFDDPDGRPIAHVVNWANHNNAAPFDVISADYAGTMADHLRAVYGAELVVLFLPGAAGNVNWIDHEHRDSDPWLYRRIGKSLAGAALGAEAQMERIEPANIGLHRRNICVPERPYRPYDITIDGTFGDPVRAGDFWAAYRTAYDRDAHLPLPEHEVDVYVLTLGNQVALCTNPAELFTEYGLSVKQASPYPYTMVSELTNGLIGYVATPDAFEEGGYEVRKVPGNSFMAVDTGERIVQAWVELLGLANA